MAVSVVAAGPRQAALQNGTFLTASVVVALVALPILSIFYLAANPVENIWPHLFRTVLPYYISETLTLLFLVACGTLTIGISTAWLVATCRFPGRSVFQWILLLPLAMPAYVVAYAYTDLLDVSGPVQQILRGIFGWESVHDYYFPEIRSMGGAAIVLTLVLYPYVYMLARSAFSEQSNHLFECSRVLGKSTLEVFLTVSVPMARPAIAVGLAFALMETINDFGTVDYFAVHTLTAGIVDVWLGMGNIGGAAQIAAVMLVFVAVLLFLERFGRRYRKYYETGNGLNQPPVFVLQGGKKYAATAACLIPVLLGFLVPVLILGDYAVRYFDVTWTPDFRTDAFNSFSLSLVAALSATVVALFLAYSVRLVPTRILQALSWTSGLGYAVPGAVLAIGVIVPFAWLDNSVDAIARTYFNTTTGLVLTGSVFAIVFAYTVRFLTISRGAVDSSLSKISPSMDMAARSLGNSASRTLVMFHLPMIRKGLATGAIVVFVDCMKELPATLILRPFNFNTLATSVYEFASDELIEMAALGSLMIVAVGLIPVLLLNRTVSTQNTS